jgi:DNA-binding HxlR family transcriptional regulator
MSGYGQYCPVARGAEVFAERWTPIIVRNLLLGCTTFNDISAGAPGLSRSLLAQRLRQLGSAGIISAHPKPRGHGSIYQLTPAGRGLATVVDALGAWGEQWLILREEHTNPVVVLWAWTRFSLERTCLPARPVLVRFDFADQVKYRHLWIHAADGAAEMCDEYPGFSEDLVVEMDSMTLLQWHLGRLGWADALRAGRIRVSGPPSLARALPTWHHFDAAAAVGGGTGTPDSATSTDRGDPSARPVG